MLGMYNSCPFNFKHWKWPLDPAITFKWDILNVAVTSQWSHSPFLDRYKKNLEPDFKNLHILEDVLTRAHVMMDKIKGKHELVRQEAKMMRKYSDEYRVVWTPDLMYYDAEQDMMCVRDWKMSTHWRYGNPEVTKFDLQPIFYSKFVMEFFDVDKVSFAFRCFDKKNGKLWEFGAKKWIDWPAIYTKEEVDKVCNDVMERYSQSIERDSREPQENKKCGFCKMKKEGKCPLYKKAITTVESTEDFF